MEYKNNGKDNTLDLDWRKLVTFVSDWFPPFPMTHSEADTDRWLRIPPWGKKGWRVQFPLGPAALHMIPLMILKGVWGWKGPANYCTQSVVEAQKAERGILRSVKEQRYLPEGTRTGRGGGGEGSPPRLLCLGSHWKTHTAVACSLNNHLVAHVTGFK